VLKLLVAEAGRVEEVLVLVSDPEGVFDGAAIAAFGGALLTPGRRARVPVKCQVLRALKFHPMVPELQHHSQAVDPGVLR
jgi:outer membrane biosynthesis protein TonB